MKRVTVMCDYCADGLWEDGIATDAEILGKELNWTAFEIGEIGHKAALWQEEYESFDLWDPKLDIKKLKDTEQFQSFIEYGINLSRRVRELVPPDIEVGFFNDFDNRWYVVPFGKEPLEIYRKDKDVANV